MSNPFLTAIPKVPTPATGTFVPPVATGIQPFGLAAGPADFGIQTMEKTTAGHFIIIIGPPFFGKTTACYSFPNARFMNLDSKLAKGTQYIPFDEPAFCDRLAPRTNKQLPPNRQDAVFNWLYRNVGQIPADWTLVLDSFSSLCDAFHLQAEKVDDIGTSKAGNRALIKVFGAKLTYLEAIFTLLKLAPCRVIVTAHTMPEFDDQGNPTGAVKPFCTGSFSDKICGYATDVVRAYMDIDPATGRPRVDASGKCIGYRWKLRPDRACRLVGTMINLPPDIDSCLADYSEFNALAEKYGVLDQRISVEPASAQTESQTAGA